MFGAKALWILPGKLLIDCYPHTNEMEPEVADSEHGMIYDAWTLILCSVPVHEEMSFVAWLVLVLVSHS